MFLMVRQKLSVVLVSDLGPMHPGSNFSEAVCQGGVGCCGDGFWGDVNLDIVCKTVEMETMLADDVTEGEHVENEQERTKHRTLGDALGQKNSGGGAVKNNDELLFVGEI